MRRVPYLTALRLTLFLPFLVANLGCEAIKGTPQKQSPPPIPTVTTGKPLIKTVVDWDAYSGRLTAVDTVDVRSRVSGYLNSHHFTEGEVVQKGQLLFVIDPRPFEAALSQARAAESEAIANFKQSQAAETEAIAQRKQAEAKAQLADAQLRRARPLVPSGAISQDEFDVLSSEAVQAEANLYAAEATIESARAGIVAAEAMITTAKAGVESAQLDLGYTRIESPITGKIGAQLMTDGNLIGGGLGASQLASIVSLDPIQCDFDANEQSLMKYIRLRSSRTELENKDRKSPVMLALIDETGFPHKGHLDFVDNKVDRSTGSIRARAIFNNKEGILTPGMFAKLRIPGSLPYEAILIPESAVGTDQASQFVYVVDESNKIKLQTVVLGTKHDGLRVVLKGLTGNETIVTSGLQRCRADAVVEPTLKPIKPTEDDNLPDDFEFVPRDRWIGTPAVSWSQEEEVSIR